MILEADEAKELFAYVFKTRADQFTGRINLFRVYQGVMKHDSQVLNTRCHAKERIGQLLDIKGKETSAAEEFGPGDIGAVAKLKETKAGDWLAARDEPISMPQVKLPAPVMAFAIEPKAKGDEEKVFSSLRRLQEEDPTIDLHRDQQTGEQIVAGLTQVHVEVIVDRLRDRFGAEVTLKPPRVPYLETIRSGAKAHGRHKKQSGGRGQFGDCHIELEPLEQGGGFEFVNKIKGGVIPTGFIPAVEKGVREAMEHGVVAGYPVKDVRVVLYDGSYHTVDSSEMAFKVAGSIAMKEALEQASPVLLEPIMLVTVSVPEDAVGDVIGDLNSRRGRPLGMEPVGRDDRGQGRGPDGGDALLRPRPARDHRRPGRVHDGARALRGGARASGAEGGGGGGGRRGGRPGVEGCPLGVPGALIPSLRPMAKREIRTNQADLACDVCGRTLLRGEAAEPYLAGGQRRQVCELCTARAVHEGWIREGAGSGELPARRPSRNGRRSFIGRFRGRRERERPAPTRLAAPPEPVEAEAPPVEVPEPVAAPEPAVAAPEPLHAEPRHVHAVPTNDDLKVARALELFNVSEHPRTVAGVARSLGGPFVAVHPTRHEPSVVAIVVGWELSWYRFEVDLSDEAGGVRQVEQGQELSELPELDRAWNAGADEHGGLQLVAVQ